MEKDLFSWEDWEMADELMYLFKHCTMLRNFWPLREGEKYDSIALDYENGRLLAYKDGKEVSVGIALVPVPGTVTRS
jgi:hypothetical protein